MAKHRLSSSTAACSMCGSILAVDCSRLWSGKSTAIACVSCKSCCEALSVGGDGRTQRLERGYQYCWQEGRDVVPMRACQAGPAHSFSAEVVAAILSTRQGNFRRGVGCGTILRSGSMLGCRKCSALPIRLLVCSSMVYRLHEMVVTRLGTVLGINSEETQTHAAEGLQMLLPGLWSHILLTT